MLNKNNIKNIKMGILLIFALIIIFCIPSPTLASASPKLLVNGQEIQSDVQPQVINGRTYFPIRVLAYSLNVTDNNILWDANKQTVTIIKGDKVVQMIIGDIRIFVDGKATNMDVSPLVIEGRTMLPVSWLAGALGYTVGWDDSSQTININGAGTGTGNIATEVNPTVNNTNPITPIPRTKKYLFVQNYKEAPLVPSFSNIVKITPYQMLHGKDDSWSYAYKMDYISPDNINAYMDLLKDQGFVQIEIAKEENVVRFKKDMCSLGIWQIMDGQMLAIKIWHGNN